MPEALQWLRTNRNPQPFAGNMFYDRRAAIAAIELIYAAGAESVNVEKIYDEPWRILEEGGPYAATLIIKVPPRHERDVKRVVRTLEPDEFDEVGPGVYRAWWD